jgi:hypothetical protein
VAYVVEHLPRKHKALTSNPIPPINKCKSINEEGRKGMEGGRGEGGGREEELSRSDTSQGSPESTWHSHGCGWASRM